MKQITHIFTWASLIILVVTGMTVCKKAGTSFDKSKINSNKKNIDINDHRIICATPSITEIVFFLGLGDHVVGVSDFTIYPSEASQITTIGGIFNPNRERLIALEPDLIITQGKHESLAKFCRERKIRFISVKMDSLNDVFTSILKLGEELNVKSKAEELKKNLETELLAVKEKTSKFSAKKVFLTLGHTPGDMMGLMTTGSGTFIHELIEIAGGINIFADATGLYPQISKEALLLRQPDVIIEIIPDGFSANNRDLLRSDWDRLFMLNAIKNNHIHFLSDEFLLIPGVRIPIIAQKLAATIHPEAFE